MQDQEHSKLENNADQVEKADIGVDKVCRSSAAALHPAKCTARGEGRETAEVGKTVEVNLTTKLKLTNNMTAGRSVAVDECLFISTHCCGDE